MQKAGPQVPVAKQGRSLLHQSLELSNTENLEIFLEFNKGAAYKSEFDAAVQWWKTVSASCPVCCIIAGGLIPDFISCVSISSSMQPSCSRE